MLHLSRVTASALLQKEEGQPTESIMGVRFNSEQRNLRNLNKHKFQIITITVIVA